MAALELGHWSFSLLFSHT